MGESKRSMNLLSDNDWNTLSDALSRTEEPTLTVTLGGTEITASVERATKAHSVAMLIGVELKRNGRISDGQWCESIEEAQKMVRRWRVW